MPRNNSVPVRRSSTAHRKGRSRRSSKGSGRMRRRDRGDHGDGGGAGAALVDVDPGVVEHAAERLRARRRRTGRRSRAPRVNTGPRPRSISASLSSMLDCGLEPRQRDRCRAAGGSPVVPVCRSAAPEPSRATTATKHISPSLPYGSRTACTSSSSKYSNEPYACIVGTVGSVAARRRERPRLGARGVERLGPGTVEVDGVGEREHLVRVEARRGRSGPSRACARRPRRSCDRARPGPGNRSCARRCRGRRAARGPRRATPPARARGRRPRRRSRAAPASGPVVERLPRGAGHARTQRHQRFCTLAGDSTTCRRRDAPAAAGRSVAVAAGITGSRAAPARARSPRTGP